jgi:hypothetical protein
MPEIVRIICTLKLLFETLFVIEFIEQCSGKVMGGVVEECVLC